MISRTNTLKAAKPAGTPCWFAGSFASSVRHISGLESLSYQPLTVQTLINDTGGFLM